MRKALCLIALLAMLTGCRREPELHLFDAQPNETKLLFAELNLDVYWDYILDNGVKYDWRAEWYYGWDEEDQRIFGEIGYTIPDAFDIRRYYTGSTPYAHHTSVLQNTIQGRTFRGEFTWGYWDMLVFNDVRLIDGVQSLNFDETTTLDSITVYTNQSMSPSRYHAPRYTHAFYEPEELFSAYQQAININRNLEGFVYDPELNTYVLRLSMTLTPITYIYLTQIILHHNRGKITSIDGSANISGFARWSVLNSGRGGEDPITVNYKSRLKRGCDMEGENVDIIGGRLLTFGICGHSCNNIKNYREVKDVNRHYLDVRMQFNNGLDSTFVFDVTDQVRHRYKGGVLTVELDMDSISIPRRPGGSAFDAVVEDYEEVTHEFEM